MTAWPIRTLSTTLWIIAIAAVAIVAARETNRLPHIVPMLGVPIDEEGRLEMALKQQTPGPVADCGSIDANAKVHALPPEELARRLEKATVLVLTEHTSGSGFFISKTQILTNRHVVEDQTDGRVIVTSKSLGHIVAGNVVAITNKGDPGAPDFAIIEVTPIEDSRPLAVGPSVEKLQRVTVAGYPGLSMQTDPGFLRLVKDGDLSAAPGLRLSEGAVSNILTSDFGLTEIDHSAEVFKGNSGGPLVDACGRVVGINTFIAVDESQSGRINYALAAGDFVKFLKAENMSFDQDDRRCG